MPDEDKTFGGSFVLDFRKWWRHVKTIYTYYIQRVYKDQTLEVNAPVIWNPRLSPFGLERGIHFLSKWKRVKSPVPGDNSEWCSPPPLLFHTHTVLPL